MASREEIVVRPRPSIPALSLIEAPIPGPRRSGWLNSARTSLRAQAVALFILLVVFAISAILVGEIAGAASDASQREQVNLITWRYETVRISLSAEALRTDLAEMNNALLNGDTSLATLNRTQAQADITFIDSGVSLISALSLPSDDAPIIAKDGGAFRDLTAFARQFIAAAPHTDSEMLAQTDAAFSAWRAARAPVDAYIQSDLQGIQALNNARTVTSQNVTIAAGIGAAVLLLVLAFYQFFLTLRPVVKLAKVATKLAAGEPVTIKPSGRRDELGVLTGALAAWQRSSQNVVDGLRDGSSRAAAAASGLSTASEQLAAATAQQTAATAESCTAGLVAAMLTEVPGSSAWFLGGWVVYANRMKTAALGVPAELVAREGAVSEPVVRRMAVEALQRSSGDYALALTGVAGPEGGSPEKPVGTVWIGLGKNAAGQAHVVVERFLLFGDRAMIRERAAKAALNMLRLELLKTD